MDYDENDTDLIVMTKKYRKSEMALILEQERVAVMVGAYKKHIEKGEGKINAQQAEITALNVKTKQLKVQASFQYKEKLRKYISDMKTQQDLDRKKFEMQLKNEREKEHLYREKQLKKERDRDIEREVLYNEKELQKDVDVDGVVDGNGDGGDIGDTGSMNVDVVTDPEVPQVPQIPLESKSNSNSRRSSKSKSRSSTATGTGTVVENDMSDFFGMDSVDTVDFDMDGSSSGDGDNTKLKSIFVTDQDSNQLALPNPIPNPNSNSPRSRDKNRSAGSTSSTATNRKPTIAMDLPPTHVELMKQINEKETTNVSLTTKNTAIEEELRNYKIYMRTSITNHKKQIIELKSKLISYQQYIGQLTALHGDNNNNNSNNSVQKNIQNTKKNHTPTATVSTPIATSNSNSNVATPIVPVPNTNPTNPATPIPNPQEEQLIMNNTDPPKRKISFGAIGLPPGDNNKLPLL